MGTIKFNDTSICIYISCFPINCSHLSLLRLWQVFQAWVAFYGKAKNKNYLKKKKIKTSPGQGGLLEGGGGETKQPQPSPAGSGQVDGWSPRLGAGPGVGRAVAPLRAGRGRWRSSGSGRHKRGARSSSAPTRSPPEPRRPGPSPFFLTPASRRP